MNIVIIGTLYDITDPENPVAKPGWHVDTLEPVVGAGDYLIEPVSPRHCFSGVAESYRYKFENEQQANDFMGLNDADN